jgi:pyruvate,water dikinase
MVVNDIATLAEATDVTVFGPKAVQLGAACRAGLPVPGGIALSHPFVAAACAADDGRVELEQRLADWELDRSPHAVRSSAVGEDSAESSFAGIHLSLLGVRGVAAVADAVRQVHASARDAGALAYRDQRGFDAPIRMAVIVQDLVDSDVAGVMFTRNPVTGADERVIEASWGLGESVVAGLVTPDRYVLDRSGRLVDQQLGDKDLLIRRAESGGTVEEPVVGHLVDAPCLTAGHLNRLHELALQCDAAFGSTEHDIEFAFRGEEICLLQRRPITRA